MKPIDGDSFSLRKVFRVAMFTCIFLGYKNIIEKKRKEKEMVDQIEQKQDHKKVTERTRGYKKEDTREIRREEGIVEVWKILNPCLNCNPISGIIHHIHHSIHMLTCPADIFESRPLQF